MEHRRFTAEPRLRAPHVNPTVLDGKLTRPSNGLAMRTEAAPRDYSSGTTALAVRRGKACKGKWQLTIRSFCTRRDGASSLHLAAAKGQRV